MAAARRAPRNATTAELNYAPFVSRTLAAEAARFGSTRGHARGFIRTGVSYGIIVNDVVRKFDSIHDTH